MGSICQKTECTLCGACKNVCPKSCITETFEDDGFGYMILDEDKCINCKLCEKVCPNISIAELNDPKQAYAAWSTSSEEHAKAASGGIATELYKYALNKGYWVSGVAIDGSGDARMIITNTHEDIERFRNSKYTFSHMGDTYGRIANLLQAGNSVLFCGLPCQVAALKNYMRTRNFAAELITVDLVCHGCPPEVYLKEHIKYIEDSKKNKTESVLFRDPQFGTNKFYFTLRSNDRKLFYKKDSYSDDLYQIGYHKALIYRENCYQCRYAQKSRAGDLTLGDYHGLGKVEPYYHSRTEVSMVLVNTPLGEEWLAGVREHGNVEAYERPLQEPFTYEHQLNRPSVAPEERGVFLEKYTKCRNYETAAKDAFKKYVMQSRLEQIISRRRLKLWLMGLVPRRVKESIKNVLKKVKRRSL